VLHIIFLEKRYDKKKRKNKKIDTQINFLGKSYIKNIVSNF